jgi:Ser/Thr protein kinase RdoA (MazF antagonist)
MTAIDTTESAFYSTGLAQLLGAHYGEMELLTDLEGDRDSNFKVRLETGRTAVLKLMHPDCDVKSVALQCAALNHLSACPLKLPSVIPDRTGSDWQVVTIGGRQRLIWLLNWCPGTLLAHVETGNAALYASFGEVLATLNRALEDFHPSTLPPGSHWDLTRALEVSPFLGDIHSDSRATAQKVLLRFEEFTRHRLPGLSHGIIHNDANDHNVLVDVSGEMPIVTGLFDFGDLSWQPVICDVAIALTYLLMGKKNPLEVCGQFLKGYSIRRSLSPKELEMLFDLIQTRLVVSIAISSHRQLSEPDNAYITISQQPAVQTLEMLQKVDPEQALASFKQACIQGESGD